MSSAPSYDGAGLVNLMAELELKLTGQSAFRGLAPDLAASIPEADTYVLVLFDGLGVAQLGDPLAQTLATSRSGTLEAPFPTTTSVSLATIATGLPPSRHGQVAHLMWMPDLGKVVNSLKWVTPAGESVPYGYSSVLPSPNLWERLRDSGVEPVTVQPGDFSGSPLSRVLYRGARFEGAWDVEDLVKATVQLASEPRRLIFTYVPHVDFAGHVFGLESGEFAEAMKVAVGVWERIASLLPPGVALIGTADHGLVEFADDQKQLIRDPRFDELRFGGDTRGLHLWGDKELMSDLADMTGGSLVDGASLIGPDPTPEALSRLGERVLLAPDDRALIPKGFDKRLRCYHGGLSTAEVEIPLLVG
ncbi:MAG: alkaline phosphatase family protein [Acidimicrobiia bacterium]